MWLRRVATAQAPGGARLAAAAALLVVACAPGATEWSGEAGADVVTSDAGHLDAVARDHAGADPGPADDAGAAPDTVAAGDRGAGQDRTPSVDAAPRVDAAPTVDAAPGVDHPPAGTLTPGSSTLSVSAAGQARSVLLAVPSEVSSGPRPLVIALHGNGDSAANFVATIGLAGACDTRGVILAAPQGISQTFDYLGQHLAGIDWDAYRSEAEGNIDLPLLDSLRQQLVATGSVEVSRIYLFGYSQGGYLAFRGAMEDADALAAAAVVAAANPLPGSSLIADAARPIPIALTIGSNDWAVDNARQTRDQLQAAGHEVRYEEIAGAGHVPFPGDAAALLDWLLARSL